MSPKISFFKCIAFSISALLSFEAIGAAASDKNATGHPPSVFATVGKVTVPWQDVEAEYKKEAKNKFFHGKPADSVIAELQRSVGNKLVTNALILNEANRRKLKPDAKIINQQVADYEARFATDPQWGEARERVLPVITKHFQDEYLVKKLEEIVRKVPTPKETQVRSYYASHPEKFTAPVEQRVSVILLSVDPSATNEAWAEATDDAKLLLKQIREGADFAEMAKKYSKDGQTVDQGGDMGYLHDGMLPGLPQETVNKLQVGEVSEPTRLLEGIALFRLTERKTPGLSNFDSVKQRALELLTAEMSDSAWSALLDNLRAKTPTSIDESRFLPLGASDSPEKNDAVTTK